MLSELDFKLNLENLIENTSTIKLVNTYKILDKLKFEKFILIVSNPLLKALEKLLLSNWASVRLFNLYKLLIYLKEKQNV